MQRTFTRILLLAVCVMLVAGLAVNVSAADYTDHDTALDYLENYDSNVGADADFATNVKQALETVRQTISQYATFWSLLPPVIAIALALITKEVYFSLFVGILSGALIYADFSPWGMVTNTFDVMIGKLSDGWNVGIMIFLVTLGMMVALINKAGGSAAYGRWAAKRKPCLR